MKKKIIIPLMLSCVMALSTVLAGCSSSTTAGPISNEYVEVNKYKGLEIPVVEKEKVTDEQVEEKIEEYLSANNTYTSVKRAAKEGDQVNIDFVGKIDGVAFDNGSAEGQDLVLGSGSYIGAEGDYKGFEEQLVGHKAGENFDITVKFSEDYSGEVAGKVATFTITMNDVKEETKAELNDETVASLSSTSKTVEEYRKEIRKELEDKNEEEYNQKLEQEVYQELLANTKIVGDVQSEVDEYYNMMYENYSYYATMYGMEMKDFCETYLNMTEEELEAYLKENAENVVAFKYACNLIAEKTNLTLTDAEFKEKGTKLAEEYGFTDSEASSESTEEAKTALEQFIEQSGEEEIRNHLTQEKVMEYLVKNSKQTNDATTATESESDTTAE